MLRITIPATEIWNESKSMFEYMEERELCLEHSLVSIAKWESKWHKPFLTKDVKSREETIHYIKCMTITQNVNPNLYNCLTSKNLKEINEYIEDPMTATWFSGTSSGKTYNLGREQVTSELIYYWMTSLNIPFECQKWHINRLFTLIRICNIKNQSPKKQNKREIMSRNTALNAARKKKLNTKG